MKSKKKVVIIISIIIIMLLIIGGIVAFLLLNNNNKEEKKLEWGDVYLEVLNDDKFEALDDMEIQLCDLNGDNVPELIVYGLKSLGNYIANIYKINDDNKVDTISVDVGEKFTMQYLYSLDEEKYGWYAVTDTYTKDIYNLNIDNEEYKPEKVDGDYSSDYVPVDEKVSKKVPLDKEATKSEKREAFNETKENYVPTEEMVTEEIEKKVETAKNSPRYDKVDDDKDLIYSVLEVNGYSYPAINVNTTEVKNINNKIKDRYGFTSYQVISGELSFSEIETVRYTYNETDDITSLIVARGGNSSTWANSYNISTKKGKIISNEELLNKKGININEMLEKAVTAVTNDFEATLQKDKNEYSQYWESLGYNTGESEWRDDLSKNITKDSNLYLDENGKICMIAEYEHPGGQWCCTQTVIVHIEEDYIVEKLTIDMIKDFSTNSEPSVSTSTTTTTSSSPTPTTPTTPTTSSNNPTEKNAISKDKAQELAQSVWGTKSDETGYEIGYAYSGWGKDEQGKQYYVFNARWLVGDHWSYIGTICIAVDGKSYKQLDSIVNTTLNGDVLSNLLPGGEF